MRRAAVALLVLAACKEPPKEVAKALDAAAPVARTATRAAAKPAEIGKELPSGFPLALGEGARIENAARATMPDGVVVYSVTARTRGDPEAVAAFYEKQLRDKQLEVTRASHAAGDTRMLLVSGRSAASEGAAQIDRSPGSEDLMLILTWRQLR